MFIHITERLGLNLCSIRWLMGDRRCWADYFTYGKSMVVYNKKLPKTDCHFAFNKSWFVGIEAEKYSSHTFTKLFPVYSFAL